MGADRQEAGTRQPSGGPVQKASFVAAAPVRLRNAHDGLAAAVRQSPGHDPLRGGVHVLADK